MIFVAGRELLAMFKHEFKREWIYGQQFDIY
jgi:hypothetical protein